MVIITLGLKNSLEKKGQKNKGELTLKQGMDAPAAHLNWGLKKIPCRACLLFYCFSGDEKKE